MRNNEFGTLESSVKESRLPEAHAAASSFCRQQHFPAQRQVTSLDDMAPVVAEAGRPDHVRSRPDRPGAKTGPAAIHSPVQSIRSTGGRSFLENLGLSCIILSRELSLDEVAEIRRQQCPDIELEVFVHGALCIAYSGRCLLSGYFKPPRPEPG